MLKATVSHFSAFSSRPRDDRIGSVHSATSVASALNFLLDARSARNAGMLRFTLPENAYSVDGGIDNASINTLLSSLSVHVTLIELDDTRSFTTCSAAVSTNVDGSLSAG